MAEADILRIFEEGDYSVPGKVEVITVVEYKTRDTPPRSVRIPKRQPADEEIAAAIRQDLEIAAAEAPRTISF